MPADEELDAAIQGYRLTTAEREWVVRTHYREFLTRKTNRGMRGRPNGKTYTHSEVAEEFIEKFWQTWDDNKKIAYRKKLNSILYNLLNNTFAADEEAWKDNEVAKAQLTPRRVNTEHKWSKDNSKKINEAINQYLDDTPGTSRSVGTLRRVVCCEFNNLTSDEKQMWEAWAEAERAKEKLKVPLKGDQRDGYMKTWMTKLNQLALEGQKIASLLLISFICWDGVDQQGAPISHIDSYMSGDIIDYQESPEFTDSHAKLTKWYQAFKGVTVKGGDPPPAVVPNPNSQYWPEMPPLEEKTMLGVYRRCNHDFLNAEYLFYGGVGPVPWKIISLARSQGQLHLWVTGWPADLEFGDPGSQTITVAWRVNKLANPPPPHCSADRVSMVEFRGHMVHQLEYDGPVDKPQSERAVAYPPRCWAYFYSQLEKKSLEHWLGLESISNTSIQNLFSSDVFAFVRSLLELVDQTLSAKLIKALESVNEMEKHGPFTVRQYVNKLFLAFPA
ncbi:hypothetical protein CTheo_8382 [Ceratobasidium theobromae]|uniref:Uncharacterized protein n=1 Tax=Ceratobasidium theobromae TaxID=1582974 RepID=A0A5N5Q924_9AGAM|nr:hypothetical protein CTheo_8382 [Ceratobasidium theobromae]